MKALSIVILSTFLTIQLAWSQNFSGVYDTNFKKMTLTQNGNQLTGTYEYSNGKVEGSVSGNTATGWWYQDNGKGRFVYVLNANGFSGKWGYNDDVPSSEWNGTLISRTTQNVGAYSASGTYSTDFNKMTLTQNGDKVTGTYEYSGGRVEGTLVGHTLTGWWFQNNGKGKMIFEFNADFSAFSGKWGANDSEPSGQWNGTRIGAPVAKMTPIQRPAINATYTTNFNDMTLRSNGNLVSGTYDYADGKVSGTLNGHTLTGTWTQSNGKGKLVFEFNADFTSFTGKWGYNDDAPSSEWNGEVKR